MMKLSRLNLLLHLLHINATDCVNFCNRSILLNYDELLIGWAEPEKNHTWLSSILNFNLSTPITDEARTARQYIATRYNQSIIDTEGTTAP